MSLAHLGIEIPIVQAPTAGIAGPELATAVSATGALGSMGLTWTDPEEAVRRVRQVRTATSRPFLVNFVLAFAPRALGLVLNAGAPIVSFSWGDPEPYLRSCRQAGAKVAMQVVNLAGIRRGVALGVDLLICQGMEAGGHVQSTQSLAQVLAQAIAAAEGIPVLAAGGIGDGAAIARVLAMGASGAVLGTRFVASLESRAHPAYKQRLVEAAADQTALTTCFDGGWPSAPHRVLRNATLEAWEAAGCPQPGHRPGEGEILGHNPAGHPILRYANTAPAAGATGQVLDMALYAGTSCSAIHHLAPAADLVHELWTDCQSTQRITR